MTTDAHRRQIMAHFRKGLSLTPNESQQLFGKRRLAARILDLRGMGHEIETILEPNENGGRHARYVLIKEAENG